MYVCMYVCMRIYIYATYIFYLSTKGARRRRKCFMFWKRGATHHAETRPIRFPPAVRADPKAIAWDRPDFCARDRSVRSISTKAASFSEDSLLKLFSKIYILHLVRRVSVTWARQRNRDPKQVWQDGHVPDPSM